MANPSASNPKYLSDEFLDWETRHESVPFWKHVIAGKLIKSQTFRIMRWIDRAL
jgi:hypothetical protein